VTTYTYDADGNLTSTTDPLGHTTKYAYDPTGQLRQTTYADGTTATLSRDALGRVVASTDATGATTRSEYDALGRLTAVVDPLGNRTQYAYDEVGDLISQTDAAGHVVRYEYDLVGRRTARILPLGQRASIVYDAADNVVSETDFNRDTTRYDYDSNNRLVAEHFADGTTTTFTYSPAGLLLTETDAQGTTTNTYDARGELTSRTGPDGRTIRYTYDAAGQRATMTTPSDTITYTYDASNRLASVADRLAGLTTYAYDPDGNLVRTALPDGTVETRTYDAQGRLLTIDATGPSGVVSSQHYTLDAAGDRVAVQEDGGRQVRYTYDADHRLTLEQITDPVAGNRTIRYTYDPAGNLLSRVDSAEGTTTFTYDANDRLTLETDPGGSTRYTYDADGHMLSRVASAVDQTIDTWDKQGRLVSEAVTAADGVHTTTHGYDASGLRVSSTTDGKQTRYLNDVDRAVSEVVEEYSADGTTLADYAYGLALIAKVAGGQPLFYHADGLGSIRALTDATGHVVARYAYDGYGRLIAQTGTAVNAYLFAGQQRDEATGDYYLRTRYYDASAARFTSADGLHGTLTNPITQNKYAYANLDPIDNTDPNGTETDVEDLSLALAIDSILVGIAVVGAGYILGNVLTELWKAGQVSTLTNPNLESRLNPQVLAQTRAETQARVETEAEREGCQGNLLYHYTTMVAAQEILATQQMFLSREATDPNTGQVFPLGAYATDIPPWAPITQRDLAKIFYFNPWKQDKADLSWVVVLCNDLPPFFVPIAPGQWVKADGFVHAILVTPNAMP
jgi:RHS repeat-associated protein